MWISLADQRVGTVNTNRYGSTMKVLEYDNRHSIWVQFEQGKPVHTSWQFFEKGGVRSPFDKSIFGVGYIGEGEYRVSVNKKTTQQYDVWHGMIQRCYSQKYKDKHPTYEDCSVLKEWHNFQNFGQWYDQNYYDVEGEVMCLDKDILKKGNKIYSPDTCVFVPNRINNLFTKRNASRGDLPIGVSWHKTHKKFSAQGSKCHIGYYSSIEEAFQAYKTFKEKVIKEVAENYENRIPNNLYEALLKYKVEITD